MSDEIGFLSALLAGVGGGSAVVAVSWAALRFWLQREFFTEQQGAALASTVDRLSNRDDVVRDGLSELERRIQRIEEIIQSDVVPQYRKQGEHLIRLREELAVMRTTVSFMSETVREVSRR